MTVPSEPSADVDIVVDGVELMSGGRGDSSRAQWCWKETASRMHTHSDDEIVGDRTHCWIKYDREGNRNLERMYQQPGDKASTCYPSPGYVVDFRTMMQTNLSTGYKREVKRFENDTVQSKAVWCWQETASNIGTHPQSEILGDRTDGWIKYDVESNERLEFEYMNDPTLKNCPIMSSRYVVNFQTMEQINQSSGYHRKIRRFVGDEVRQGENADIPWVTTRDGLTSDFKPAFVLVPEGAPRGRKPKKVGYILGNGQWGRGYYSMETKDAYRILLPRLRSREHYARKKGDDCCCPRSDDEKRRDEANLQRAITMRAFAEARLQQDSPASPVSLPPELTQGTFPASRSTAPSRSDMDRTTYDDQRPIFLSYDVIQDYGGYDDGGG